MAETGQTQDELVSMHHTEDPQVMITMGEAWDVQEELCPLLEAVANQEDLYSLQDVEDAQQEQGPIHDIEDIQKEAELDQEMMTMEEPEEATPSEIPTPETNEPCVKEIKKEDILKPELSVEPVLIIRSSPPNFLPSPGQPCVSWEKWLKSFENYTEQMGESKLTDSTKYVLLQNCLGQEGRRILTTLLPGETTYSDAVSALSVYFSSNQSSQIHLLDFNQRAQMSGESAGQFICALDQLLKPSNYQELYEQLLIKQLVDKTNNPRLRERLLSEPTPFSLARALQISAEVESTAVSEVNVYIDEAEPPVKRKRGRPRKGEVREKPPPKVKSKPKPKPAAKTSPLPKTFPLPKTSPLPKRQNKRASTSKSEDFYYGGDEQYYNEDDLTKPDTSLLTVPICKEIKTEPCDEEDIVIQPKVKHFRGINKLVRHLRSHSKQKPYSCPICESTFSQTYHLLRHMRKQHDAGEHVCSLCGITLDSADELLDHKKSHPAEPVQCPLCEEVCLSPRAFSAHIKNHCQTTKEELPSPQLPKAKKQSKKNSDGKPPKTFTSTAVDLLLSQGGTASFSDIVSHVESAPDLSDYFNKEVEAAGPDKLTEKLLSELRTEDSDDENDKLIQTNLKKPHCPVCLRTFPGLNKLLRHMQTHTKDKPFGCPMCNLTFSQSYHMTRHMKVQHGAGMYVCPKCGEELDNVEDLEKHKRIHPPDPVTCPYCNKISPNYHKFIGHFRRHGMLVDSTENADEESISQSKESDSGNDEDPMGLWQLCVVGEGETEEDAAEETVEPTILKREMPRRSTTIRSTAQSDKTPSEPNCIPPVSPNTHLDEVSEESSETQEQSNLESLRKDDEKDSDYVPDNNSCDSNDSSNKNEKSSKIYPKRHRCPHCLDRWFRGPNKLARHMRMHTKEKPFKCPICAKAFSQSYHMKRHHRVQHSQGRYTCTVCGQNLPNWIEFKNHKSLHEPGVVCCPFCDKQFKHKSLYLAHIKVHKNGAQRISGVQKASPALTVAVSSRERII
ncbi:hypothetical protein WMY93_005466 [Mugilogobius chulae]|uniref:C2H2-type domain-containing protein n=1 Tax=Mugilogobius chulae TaxID=88201 RepID=A0AAW0PLJ4_9GOBI